MTGPVALEWQRFTKLTDVRARRLEGIALAVGVAFDVLDIHVITRPSLGNGKHSITQRDRRPIKRRPTLDTRQVSKTLS